ncbi:hypothetical protein M406DRAFT_329672 [Cryphonectria parasitica EP155]|uniref:Survival Motor Neuron Gemin2-binding domain-containing protein n=1 Tax=Cryphonectria parasitica (strain ATCC 38755 / EP155) TaxID=660469 RepID=A0A9P5CPV7_CRYP1|nr:uncharacterized protein M406DRAFT_329672 [Cryphonectria parasitica EP155]KAF3765812.1 hypothetical protein M406DRAFT_329672 [Cryphonectria parasitica EP155]
MDERIEEMAHEDIWDDSALVESWNEALAEYKKYHSIHATGGKLEDLPEHAKPETTLVQGEEPASHALPGESVATAANSQGRQGGGGGVGDVAKTGAAAANGPAEERIKDDDDDHLATNGGGHKEEGQGMAGGVSGGAGLMPPPQALISSVQDEGLKRLLMSWYYAGYYTGLYEGQQKRQQEEKRNAP